MRHLGQVMRAARALREHAEAFGAKVLVANGTRGYVYAALAAAGGRASTIQFVHDPITERDVLMRLASAIRPPAATLFASRRPLAESPLHVRRRPEVAIVEACIDTEGIDECVEANPSWSRASDICLVNVSRLQEQKGHAHLLEAFEQVASTHPSVTLVCVGELSPLADPELRTKLRAQVKEADLEERVFFTGFLPPCEVYRLLARSVAAVHTALHESFGLVLLEAAYLSRPVVATAAEGPRQIVLDGETGHLVPIGDVAGLARRMNELIENRELAEVMGRRAKERFHRRFDPAVTVDDFLRVLRGLARTRT